MKFKVTQVLVFAVFLQVLLVLLKVWEAYALLNYISNVQSEVKQSFSKYHMLSQKLQKITKISFIFEIQNFEILKFWFFVNCFL